MPSPSTIITFTDADGDEFPVRLWGHGRTHQQAIDEALPILNDQEEAGAIHPTRPVKVTKITSA